MHGIFAGIAVGYVARQKGCIMLHEVIRRDGCSNDRLSQGTFELRQHNGGGICCRYLVDIVIHIFQRKNLQKSCIKSPGDFYSVFLADLYCGVFLYTTV